MTGEPAHGASGSARKISKTRCRMAQDCALCPQRIKVGTYMGLDFSSGEWVHLGCLVRKINARKS